MKERKVSNLKTGFDELHIQRIKDGDEQELRKLFEVLLPRVRLIAHKYREYDVDPEDLAQETLLKIYSYLPKFKLEQEPENFEKWCFAIAHNIALDSVRRKSSLKRSGELGSINIDDLKDLVPGDSGTRIDAERLLEEAVNLLSVENRRVVSLVLSGQSYRETANELGISHATVRYRFSKAMDELRRLVFPEAKKAHKEAV